jgi:hypothetical protein
MDSSPKHCSRPALSLPSSTGSRAVIRKCSSMSSRRAAKCWNSASCQSAPPFWCWQGSPEGFAADDLDIQTLFDDPHFVVVGARSRWARRRKLTLGDLVDLRVKAQAACDRDPEKSHRRPGRTALRRACAGGRENDVRLPELQSPSPPAGLIWSPLQFGTNAGNAR